MDASREAIENKLDEGARRQSMNKTIVDSMATATDLRWKCPGCQKYQTGSLYDLKHSPCTCGWTHAKNT